MKDFDSISDKIDDTNKKFVELEKKYWEKQKKAAVDAIDKEIDALKKKNEEQQKDNDLEKAKRKAEMSTRRVYGADGSIEYRTDPDAEEDYQKALMEKQISVLEEQKEKTERQFDILIDILDKYLNPDHANSSNKEVWSEIAKMQGASYSGGVWRDKDGNVIDLNALAKKVGGNDSKDKEVVEYKELQVLGTEQVNSKFEQLFGLASGSLTAAFEKMFGNEDLISRLVSNVMSDMVQGAVNNYSSEKNVFDNKTDTINTFNFGNIVVNKPVGDVDSFVENLFQGLPNSIERRISDNSRRI